jgi:hypothetical protein
MKECMSCGSAAKWVKLGEYIGDMYLCDDCRVFSVFGEKFVRYPEGLPVWMQSERGLAHRSLAFEPRALKAQGFDGFADFDLTPNELAGVPPVKIEVVARNPPVWEVVNGFGAIVHEGLYENEARLIADQHGGLTAVLSAYGLTILPKPTPPAAPSRTKIPHPWAFNPAYMSTPPAQVSTPDLRAADEPLECACGMARAECEYHR